MNLTHYDLDQLASGDVVPVALAGNAANVRLLDAPNFSNLRVRAGSRYLGRSRQALTLSATGGSL